MTLTTLASSENPPLDEPLVDETDDDNFNFPCSALITDDLEGEGAKTKMSPGFLPLSKIWWYSLQAGREL